MQSEKPRGKVQRNVLIGLLLVILNGSHCSLQRHVSVGAGQREQGQELADRKRSKWNQGKGPVARRRDVRWVIRVEGGSVGLGRNPIRFEQRRRYQS